MPFSSPPQEQIQGNNRSLSPITRVLLPMVIFLVLVIAYALIDRQFTVPLIGVVPIEGVILESESTIKKLQILENNPSVKGIIVRINSPGGAVAPSQEIFTELLRFKKKKVVYASIASVAASGGYYIAVGSNKIYANPGSLTGSIGVIMQTINVEKLMDKIGIRMETLKSGNNKDLGSAFRPMQPKERKLLEAVLLNTHDQFIQAISDNRSLDIGKVKKLSDGRLFTGEQAVENGLIDGLASFRETVERLRTDLGLGDKVQLYYPTDRSNMLRSLIDLEAIFRLKETFTYSGLFYLGSMVRQ